MSIRFECPAGHRMKAEPRLAGRTVQCPACLAEAVVPLTAPPVIPRSVPQPLTETGALRLLNECEVDPPVKPARVTMRPKVGSHPQAAAKAYADSPHPPENACPRCGTALSPMARICSRCRLYLVPAESGWTSVLRAASRYVRGRRAS